MKHILTATTLLALAACASTSAPKFTVDRAPTFNIASYKTYTWAYAQAPRGMNPVAYDRIRASFERNLAARGFSKASGEGDMIIGFTTGARDKVEVTDWGPVGPYYPGYGRGYRYGWAYGYNDVDVRTVTEGSLAVDVFDGKTKTPVWHGIAAKKLPSSGPSPEIVEAAVTGLVDRLAGVATK